MSTVILLIFGFIALIVGFCFLRLGYQTKWGAVLCVASVAFFVIAIVVAPGPKADTSYSDTSYSSFTNDYGTPSTKCAHSGCSRYIASSGDTNCCTTHSNRCGNCYCYIDEDALFCMDCIEDAIG